MFQVEREKLKSEEILTHSVSQKTNLDRTMQRMEEENVDFQRQLQQVQQQLGHAEQEHSQR